MELHLRVSSTNKINHAGPGGAEVYRVRIQRKPKPYYIELTADLLEAIPMEN
jgi:hypothetical protein